MTKSPITEVMASNASQGLAALRDRDPRLTAYADRLWRWIGYEDASPGENPFVDASGRIVGNTFPKVGPETAEERAGAVLMRTVRQVTVSPCSIPVTNINEAISQSDAEPKAETESEASFLREWKEANGRR